MSVSTGQVREIIRENLTAMQAISIRSQEVERGNQVSVRRIHSQLVEIEIIHPQQDDVSVIEAQWSQL